MRDSLNQSPVPACVEGLGTTFREIAFDQRVNCRLCREFTRPTVFLVVADGSWAISPAKAETYDQPLPEAHPFGTLRTSSGPLLDRMDIHIEVPPVDYDKLSSDRLGEPSAQIRKRVEAAREIQRRRFEGTDHPLFPIASPHDA